VQERSGAPAIFFFFSFPVLSVFIERRVCPSGRQARWQAAEWQGAAGVW